jgi:microcystin-dependent protein
MSDPYVGQLMLVGFNFPPVGWAYAAGQILSISQNTALFSLLGTYYGGNGTSNFALPNLQGNLAIGQGQSAGLSMYSLGETGGTGTVTLTSQTVPAHTHALQCAGGKPKENTPLGNAVANAAEVGQLFSTSVTPVSPMSTSAVSFFGSGQPHTNMMPYLALNWVIALQGIYPTRN